MLWMVPNRWAVFEYLKARTLTSGHIPTRDELESVFVGADPEEVEEGIREFGDRVRKWLREEQVYA